ncbi:MAG: glutathione S-transferase [Marivibrio sp.]|uniref:glutathione S-transferase n=1 Tax=Marivibrio sp. TaxID=2039719 RepID=UPI0032EEF42C
MAPRPPHASADLTLYIGNRAYSSWSMRAWLILAASGLPFREEMIRLREAGFREKLALASPGATVPALHDRDLVLSETLAIAEYVAECAPDAGLWPEDPRDRATARMMATRMAVGFHALREECPMNVSQRFKPAKLPGLVLEDVAQLEAMWRPRFLPGAQSPTGPFLFGRFGIVDAFFAPVAMRFYTYRVPVSLDVAGYVDALIAHPLVHRWLQDAKAEAPRDPALVGDFARRKHTPGAFEILSHPALAKPGETEA